jgi:hypothetical protein
LTTPEGQHLNALPFSALDLLTPTQQLSPLHLPHPFFPQLSSGGFGVELLHPVRVASKDLAHNGILNG